MDKDFETKGIIVRGNVVGDHDNQTYDAEELFDRVFDTVHFGIEELVKEYYESDVEDVEVTLEYVGLEKHNGFKIAVAYHVRIREKSQQEYCWPEFAVIDKTNGTAHTRYTLKRFELMTMNDVDENIEAVDGEFNDLFVGNGLSPRWEK